MSIENDEPEQSVGSGAIRNCPFAYECSRTWDGLQPTSNPRIRQCDDCQRPVYLCRTREELTRAIFAHQCVALNFYTTETVPPLGAAYPGTTRRVQQQTVGLPLNLADKECGMHPRSDP